MWKTASKKTLQQKTQKNILQQAEISQKGNKEHFTHQRKMSKLAYNKIKNPCPAKDANKENKNASHKLGKYTCYTYIWQRTNIPSV